MGAAFNALMEDCTKEQLSAKCCELMDEVRCEAARTVESIRASLEAWPDAGCDIRIARAVVAIRDKALAAQGVKAWSTATMYTRAQRDVADGLRRERDALLEQVRGLEKLQAQAWVPPKPSVVPV